MITIITVGIMARKIFERRAVIKKISLAKFKDGGAARLKDKNKNHQKEIEGE